MAKTSSILELFRLLKEGGSRDVLDDLYKSEYEPKYFAHPSVKELPAKDQEIAEHYMTEGGPRANSILREDWDNAAIEPRGLDDADWEAHQVFVDDLDQMIKRYRLKYNMPLYRGVLDVEPERLIGPTDPAFGSWTARPGIAHAFARMEGSDKPQTVLMMEAPVNSRAAVLNDDRLHGENEVVLPRGLSLEQLDDPYNLGGVDFIPVQPRTKWAEGGEVSEQGGSLGAISKLMRALSVSEENKGANQRVAAGLAKQLYGLDENGEPAFLGGLDMKPNPGIVDEILALPGLLDLVGMEEHVPEVSRQAQRDLDVLSEKINKKMGLKEAHGFRERGQEALGTMLGQIPVAARGAAKAVAQEAPSLSKRFLKSMATASEWFTPTVERSPLNYAVGTAMGGGLGGAADMLGDAAAEAELSRGMRSLDKGYAKGGKVSALNMLIKLLQKEDPSIDPDEMMKVISGTSEGMDLDEWAQEIMAGDRAGLMGRVSMLVDDYTENLLDTPDSRATQMGDRAMEPDLSFGDLYDDPERGTIDLGNAGALDDAELQFLDGFKDGPAAREQRARDILQSTPEFRNNLIADVRRMAAERAAAADKYPWKYKVGARVKGSLETPYEVLGRYIDKEGRGMYRMRTIDGEQEFDMPEEGVKGEFSGPKATFGEGGRVAGLVDAVRVLKKFLGSGGEQPQTEIYKQISKISDEHDVPVSRVLEILEGVPAPKVDMRAVLPQQRPADPQLDIIAEVLKTRKSLDEPIEFLNVDETISTDARENLATMYAKALNAHHDTVDQPSSEALGMYQSLANEFINAAAPFKKARGGRVCHCGE